MAPFLSLNTSINPEANSMWQPSSETEKQELLAQDPPLRYNWVLWEQIMQSGKSAQYSDATHKVASFGTVKGFWKYWNHLPQPSELLENKKIVREQPDGQIQVVDAIMLFREGVRPEWEDRTNANGGHFQFQLKPQLGGGQIDEYWNNLVIGMVGSTIEPAGIITGIRLVDKVQQNRASSVRIEVWFSNFDDTENVDLLQRNVEKIMCAKLDGSTSQTQAWGKTDKKSHIH